MKVNMEQYRKSPRAQFLSYDEGEFFITICTLRKKHYFGEIENGEMILSDVGIYLKEQLERCKELFSNLIIPVYVIMPNHLHFIVSINELGKNKYNAQRSPNPVLRPNPTCRRHVPTLSKYISSLKGTVTKYAWSKGYEFGWQSRYHDHLIRGLKDLNNISDYIVNNVARWKSDCFNLKY
ncbi:MAG: transposase [Duncaniella sp.]|nr:transposase [Duncaniella sp.]